MQTRGGEGRRVNTQKERIDMSLRFSLVISAALLATLLPGGAAMAEVNFSQSPSAPPAIVHSPPAALLHMARACIKRNRTCSYSTQCCSGLVCVDHGSKGFVCAPGR
jgi:hypothetical protein